MSGSPFLNAPEELWTALHKMDAARFPTQHNFTKWLTNQTQDGKVIGYRPEAMKELTSFLDTCSFRRRRDEVRDDLPNLVYSSFSVELTAEQRRLYEKIKDQLILEIEQDERTGERTVFPNTVQLRLGQACFSPELYGGSKHSAKLDELHRIVEELVSNGEKAIIFSKWAKATRIMQRELAKYNPAYVDGSVKGADRNEQQDKFNNDPACHVYIGTIKANQEAITLNAATYVIFTDIEWSPLANHQAAGRSAAGGLRGINLGEDVKVNIIEIRGHDTIDESIAVYLAKKQKLFDQVIDSNRIEKTMRLNISDIKALLK
jgi:SNF2 family DNA or RNA helicase